MKRILRSMFIVGVLSFAALGFMVTPAISGGAKDSFDIHVHAPHMIADETIRGPYHHFCKGVQGDEVFQCLIFSLPKQIQSL